MWSDADADPPECSGAGQRVRSAAPLPNGFPDGRALCPVCEAFVPLVGVGDDVSPSVVLAPHAAFRAATDEREARNRAEWFNTHGWD